MPYMPVETDIADITCLQTTTVVSDTCRSYTFVIYNFKFQIATLPPELRHEYTGHPNMRSIVKMAQGAVTDITLFSFVLRVLIS